MFDRLRECAEYAAELGFDIAINTNGLLISEHIGWMARIRGLSVRVNLGGTTPAVLQLVHGRAALEALRGGLELASDACVLQRLNVVLSRHNLLEVLPLLDLCRKLGTALKVFDLFGVPEMEDEWLSLYAPPSALGIHGVAAPVTQYSERFGIPSRTQVVDGVHVTIRDSALGTRYGRNCEQCARFPCQEGLYCLVDGSAVPPRSRHGCSLGR
jgi:molybdenum cofactor biosynthesis enzyme MoaA